MIGTATAASLAAIVILTAAAPNVTTHVSFLAVVIAGPIYVIRPELAVAQHLVR